MKDYVLHKTEATPDDALLFFSTIIVIILTVKTELYLAFTPILVLLTIGTLGKMILFFKWQFSFALKLTSESITLNHSIFYNKLSVPLSSIYCFSREKRYMELKENSGIRRRGKKRISFVSLSDSERQVIFDRFEDFGIISI